MRDTYYLILTCIFFLSTGCAQNLLVKRLKDHGIRKENTVKLKFISSEGAFGGDVYVITEDPDVIKSVWNCIRSAEPTNKWYASGFHRIEFYTKRQEERPGATIMLNVSDAAYMEGDLWYHLDAGRPGYYGLWKCNGLNELVMQNLKREYTRRKSGS